MAAKRKTKVEAQREKELLADIDVIPIAFGRGLPDGEITVVFTPKQAKILPNFLPMYNQDDHRMELIYSFQLADGTAHEVTYRITGWDGTHLSLERQGGEREYRTTHEGEPDV